MDPTHYQPLSGAFTALADKIREMSLDMEDPILQTENVTKTWDGWIAVGVSPEFDGLSRRALRDLSNLINDEKLMPSTGIDETARTKIANEHLEHYRNTIQSLNLAVK